MAKKRNQKAADGNILFATGDETNDTPGCRANDKAINPTEFEVGSDKEKSFLTGLGRGERFAVIGVCLLLVVGALGAGLSERIGSVFTSRRSSQNSRQSAKGGQTTQNATLLSRLNPLAAVVTSPTPQLSKEYIYAGSRMMAVEDAAASAVPPADLAVWRPSSGYWYVLGGTGSQQTFTQWGQSGDVPVPGDYDGDGKTDFAVFRPSNNNWYITLSSSGAYSNFVLGNSGDKTATADYDGDGKTDVGVYRPSNGTWYFIRSSDQVTASGQFGISTDTPAPADYDGDGRADFGVWRDGVATFYVKRSTDGTLQIQALGTGGDTPVPADYDGDGRADFAVRHLNDWTIRYSSTNRSSTITWQLGSDKAVQNDYDGDGKVDIAVWRDSNGTWYIRNSRDSTTRTAQWGQSGDTPVPAFYRR